MDALREALQSLTDSWNLGQFPPLQRVIESMDPIAWILVSLLAIAVVIGLVFNLSTRYIFLRPEDVEVMPAELIGQLKRDPTRMAPAAVVNRLGADATLELLAYGDQINERHWRTRWSPVREELLRLLSHQNAFGPIYALARYYASEDLQDPATLRIRRTALIHKLGRRRYLEPNTDQIPAQLRIFSEAEEESGDLGFDGPSHWLLAGQEPPPTEGPVVEMDPIEFSNLDNAVVRLRIKRSPSVGAGFRLHLKRRSKLWTVTEEETEWVS